MYMSVSAPDEGVLVLSRTPDIRGWSIVVVGLLSAGLGAAYYDPSALALKVAYVAGCLALGLSFLEDWEECRIDKVRDEIILQRGKVYQKLLGLQNMRNVTVPSTNVMNVRVNVVEKGSNLNPTLFAVVLILKTGLSLPIAEAAKSSNSSELHLLAEKIRMFLKLSRIETLSEDMDEDDYFHSYEDSSSESEEEIEAPCGRLRETIALIHDGR